ncbi:MAG: hypothetical protein WBM32_22430, partial [Crocosphaera sp.]
VESRNLSERTMEGNKDWGTNLIKPTSVGSQVKTRLDWEGSYLKQKPDCNDEDRLKDKRLR